jgi:hypothetical protein
MEDMIASVLCGWASAVVAERVRCGRGTRTDDKAGHKHTRSGSSEPSPSCVAPKMG